MTRFNLRNIPLFRGLNGCDLTTLLGQAQQKAIPLGSVFFREDDAAAHCHLLVSGTVKLAQASMDGTQVVARFVSPGEMFGWGPVLGATAYSLSAEAMVDCAALVWDVSDIRKGLMAHPLIALNALELLGGRLRETQARLLELATEKVERRLARSVLRLAADTGRAIPEGVEIGFPVSRQDLAETTGATLHTVSRILAGWEHIGIIGGSRQRIVLLLPGHLEALIEDRV